MLDWKEFSAAAPAIAERGGALLYEHGLGLGFLGTVRADGGPRVHPICPLLDGTGLYAFLVPGPKRDDLHRDPRYALHAETFPPPRQDDAFYLVGTVEFLDRPDLRRRLTQQFLTERDLSSPWPGFEDQELVELRIDRCLLTLTAPHGALGAGHTTWAAS